jgi:hypothetical protein
VVILIFPPGFSSDQFRVFYPAAHVPRPRFDYKKETREEEEEKEDEDEERAINTPRYRITELELDSALCFSRRQPDPESTNP